MIDANQGRRPVAMKHKNADVARDESNWYTVSDSQYDDQPEKDCEAYEGRKGKVRDLNPQRKAKGLRLPD